MKVQTSQAIRWSIGLLILFAVAAGLPLGQIKAAGQYVGPDREAAVAALGLARHNLNALEKAVAPFQPVERVDNIGPSATGVGQEDAGRQVIVRAYTWFGIPWAETVVIDSASAFTRRYHFVPAKD
ncbi:MAG: hypothetical protein ACM3ZA_14365 [Bacillota bacterium]